LRGLKSAIRVTVALTFLFTKIEEADGESSIRWFHNHKVP